MRSKTESVLNILRKKAPATVAIFNKGEWYSCYDDDAMIIASEIFLSDVGLQRTTLGDEEVPMINLNVGQYNRVIRDLLLFLRHRVEIYEEINGVYCLTKKGVLGNLGDFEELVQDSVELAELSTIMAIKLIGDDDSEDNRISISFCNAQDFRITVAEFNDTPHFSNLENCIVSMAPRESLVFTSDEMKTPERWKRLDTSLNRSNVQKILVKEPVMELENFRSEVKSLLQKKFQAIELSESCLLLIRTLVNYMQLLDDERYQNQFAFVNYGSTGFMHVDSSALRALEVFSITYDQDSTVEESGSLYEFLNKCRSNPGKRLLREWLRRPLSDLRRIKERLDVVEVLIEDHSSRQVLYDDLLRRIPDIPLLSRRLVQKKATLHDCYRLYQLISLLRRFEEVIEELKDFNQRFEPAVKELVYEPILHSMSEFKNFTALIESTIDIEHAEKTGDFRIKPEMDKNLLEISSRLKEIESKAEKARRSMMSKLENESLKLEVTSEHGYLFRLTLKDANIVLKRKDVQIMRSAKTSGGVYFSHESLESLNGEFLELQSKYNDVQNYLTKLVIDTCAGYVAGLQSLSDILGVIDVLVAFSTIASSSINTYVRPELHDKGTGIFELVKCRHPVLECLPNLQFIPNDVRFHYESENEDNKPRFMVLTGANMGGKSTYLRSAVLTVLLAQCGCFVPCDSARFSIVDGIYTRVGAGDYQCKGVSTFMAEMVDCASILESATPNSLIIVDELGRGTSTYDGFGLAWAISEDIIDRIKCFCLFATHFHELAHLQDKHSDAVRNFKADTYVNEEGKLVILYKVMEGVTGRSFGLNIAEMVGFPEPVIKSASEILQSLESSLEMKDSTLASDQTDYDAIVGKLKNTNKENLREAILNLIPANI